LIAIDIRNNFITKLLLVGLKFIIFILIARFFGPLGRGVFVSIAHAAGLLVNFFSLSVGDSIIHRIASKQLKIDEALRLLLYIFLLVFSISIFAFYVFKPFIDHHFKLNEYSFYILFLIPFFLIEYLASGYLRGLKKHELVNKISLSNRATVLFFIIGVIFVSDKNDINNLIHFYLYAISINAAVYIYFLQKISRGLTQYTSQIRLPFSQIVKTIRYALKVHPLMLLMEIENRFDTFIILYFLSLEAVGIYSVAVTLSQLSFYISNSVSTVVFPYLSSKGVSNNGQVIKFIKYTFVLVSFITIALSIFGYLIINYLFGIEFREAYFLMLILLPGILFDAITRIIFTWAKSQDKTLKFLPVSIFSLLANIILAIILIYFIGIYGAALASLFSYSFRSILALRIFNKEINNKESVLPRYQDYNFVIRSIKSNLFKGESLKS